MRSERFVARRESSPTVRLYIGFIFFLGVSAAWATPVISRLEPAEAMAMGRSFTLKVHGSGFALGDQIELRRDDVPALSGRTQRIRAGSTAGDYRIEITVPAEWTRDPGVLLINVRSVRGEVSSGAALPLTPFRLTPGRTEDVLRTRVSATPEPVTVRQRYPVTIRGGPFAAGMRYEVTNHNPPIPGRCGNVPYLRDRLEVVDSGTARIGVYIGCFAEGPLTGFRLLDEHGRAVTDWIRVELRWE